MLHHIHWKIPVLKSFFNTLYLINFIKKRLHYRCFLVNIAKILRKAIFVKHRRWPLLALANTFRHYSIVIFPESLEYPFHHFLLPRTRFISRRKFLKATCHSFLRLSKYHGYELRTLTHVICIN